MPVHIEFTPAFNDYLCAQRLHARRSAWSRLNDIAARRLNPALGAIILVLALLISGPGVSWTAPFALMILCAIPLLLYPFYIRFRLKQCFTRTRMGDGSRFIDFDQHSIRANEANVRSEIEWAAIQSIKEDNNIMMLYLAPAKFIIIPKKACSEDQHSELRVLFQQNIRIAPR